MTVENMPNSGRKRRKSAREAFVLLAITLVSAAAGLGFYLQAGMSLSSAVISALALYVGLVCVHVFVRRTEAIRELSYEVDRLESEVIRLSRSANAQRPPLSARPELQPPLQARSMPPRPDAVAAPAGRPGSNIDVRAPAPQKPEGASQYWSVRPTDVVGGAPAAPSALASTEPKIAGPEGQAQPAAPRPSAGATVPHSEAAPTATPPTSGTETGISSRSEVEQISEMIRMFAEEISQPGKSSPKASAEGAEKQDRDDEAAIAASVDALRAVADEMRRPTESAKTQIEKGILPPYRNDPNASRPQPPPFGPEHAEVAALADAFASNKLDVLLEPIVGLADRKARHFEVSLRLRQGSSGGLGPREYIPMARSVGLLPVVDSIRIARAAMVARHMDERKSGGSLFAAVTADSLADERFMGEFAQAFRQVPTLRERLVLAISQSELAEFSGSHWNTIRQLAESGFRFAVDDVTSLDLDLPDLRSAGFAFVRLSAQSMVDGLAGLDGVVPAADVCQRFSGTGLSIIAVGLGSEEQLDGVLAAGVALGQGSLFGVPRAIRADAMQPARSAA